MTNPTTPAPQSHPDLHLVPGMRVRISQQIKHHDEAWSTTLEGEIISYSQQKAGSAFARSKDDKLWLDRLEIRKDDGEITLCNLDQYSHIEILTAE